MIMKPTFELNPGQGIEVFKRIEQSKRSFNDAGVISRVAAFA
jgi:hypothetical protein